MGSFSKYLNALSSPEDVQKRASTFQLFVQAAEVLQSFPKFPTAWHGSHYIYTFSGMPKAPELLVHVRDHYRAAVGYAGIFDFPAYPHARDPALEKREAAPASTREDP